MEENKRSYQYLLASMSIVFNPTSKRRIYNNIGHFDMSNEPYLM